MIYFHKRRVAVLPDIKRFFSTSSFKLATSHFLPIGAILLAIAAQSQSAVAQEQPKPAVVVAPAEISDLRPSNSFTGRAVAIQRVDLRARVVGFVEAIKFTEGASVKSGDVLYEIEDGSYRATVQEIEGSLQAAQGQLSLAQLERERQAQLVARDAVARSQLDIAEANLTKAEGEIKRLNGSLDRAKLDLSYCKITAPFDGVVGLTAADPGALVGPTTGPLATLTRLDPMTVQFPVATAQWVRYRQSKQGSDNSSADTGARAATVTLRLADGSPYPQAGQINFVNAEVSRGTDTVLVRAEFENPQGLLLDGALVSVNLEQAEPVLVLSIPQRAVQRDQLGPFVMVVGADEKVELRRVTVERTTNGRSVISQGLKEGELVITDGLNKVRPGIAVDAAAEGNG